MLYLVHLYKKKFESTKYGFDTFVDCDFLAFLVRGYGCSISHENYAVHYKLQT